MATVATTRMTGGGGPTIVPPNSTRITTTAPLFSDTTGRRNGPSQSQTQKQEERDDEEDRPLEVYLQLIDRSLQVHLLDNALWIAERCAAEYPSRAEAIYQWALCHYRCGNFKAARHALEQRIYCINKHNNKSNNKKKNPSNFSSSSNNNIRMTTSTTSHPPASPTTATTVKNQPGDDDDDDDGKENHPMTTNANNAYNNNNNNTAYTYYDELEQQMDYLEALCCHELQEYSRAEECLLRKARVVFREQQQQQQLQQHVTNNNNGKPTCLDDWIFQTLTTTITTTTTGRGDGSSTTATITTIIPMGSAGFCLLGKILLRSHRQERAIPFLRASLQLDPCLWTSMEALAQLDAYTPSVQQQQQSHEQQPMSTSSGEVVATTTTTMTAAGWGKRLVVGRNTSKATTMTQNGRKGHNDNDNDEEREEGEDDGGYDNENLVHVHDGSQGQDDSSVRPFHLSRHHHAMMVDRVVRGGDDSSTASSSVEPFQNSISKTGTRLSFGGTGNTSTTPASLSTPVNSSVAAGAAMAEDDHPSAAAAAGTTMTATSIPRFPSTVQRGGGRGGTNHTSTVRAAVMMQTPGLTPIAPASVSRVYPTSSIGRTTAHAAAAAPETPFPSSSSNNNHMDPNNTTTTSLSFLAPRQTHNNTTLNTTALGAGMSSALHPPEEDNSNHDEDPAGEDGGTRRTMMMNLLSPETPLPPTTTMTPGGAAMTTTTTRPRTRTRFTSEITNNYVLRRGGDGTDHDDDDEGNPIEGNGDENDCNLRNVFPASLSTSWGIVGSEAQQGSRGGTSGEERLLCHEDENEMDGDGLAKNWLKKKRKQGTFSTTNGATATGTDPILDNHQQDPILQITEPHDAATVMDPNAYKTILHLIETAAIFYQHVCQYRCKEALQTLGHFSKRQRDTGWVLHQQGRAHLELNEFAASQRCFELMQTKDPCRLHGLELLSTVYWHLKKEVELSHLSQRVLAMSRLSPVSWCVVGNCFSLQKDHETALVFFKRSLQIDPNFTYIHTLCGYEYMANEDFDKAIVCFRQALRVNERHYNAWYGLGAIFHRQEKFDLAEYHFERAMQLHPTSSILLCNLGISQYANGKAYQALDTLAQAFALDPQNPQARFQRASIYAALHRPTEALAELRKVRDSAPREAAVHFAMGKVLKRLGRPQEAIAAFLTAMDLDPKDNQIIKSAMDKVGEPDVSEESMSTF